MKLLKINEDRLMRSDFFAVLVSLLAAILIVFPLFLSAKDKCNEEPVKLNLDDSLSFRYLTCTRAAIVYTSNIKGNCSLTIETKDGKEVLYNENVRTMGKSGRVFDFLNLEDGEYKVVARKKGETMERPFSIKDGELIYGGRVVVDPIFITSGTRAIIELPNEHGKDVVVKVLDAKGNELYSALETRNVRKNFEFSHVEAGDYVVYVDIEGDDYKFDYNKQ